MNKQKTISINGVEYDAHTGMRIDTVKKPAHPAVTTKKTTPQPTSRTHSVAANAIHRDRTKKSTTLSRRYVSVPAHKKPTLVKKPAATHHVKSPMITKFAADTEPSTRAIKQTHTAVKHTTVPVPQHPKTAHNVAKHKPTPAKVTPVPHAIVRPTKPASNAVVKNSAIEQALANSKPNKKEVKATKRGKRLMSIATASLALVLLAGYVTYINMPSLSVRVAAMQSGVAATYPSYQPAGYSLRGPVAYEEGQVTMKFASNSSTQNFTLNQSRSTWDSSALLDNYVQQASGGQYQTYNDSGLTIYVYGTDAAWVNGGILHTINGDALLSNEQVRHIATSM